IHRAIRPRYGAPDPRIPRPAAGGRSGALLGAVIASSDGLYSAEISTPSRDLTSRAMTRMLLAPSCSRRAVVGSGDVLPSVPRWRRKGFLFFTFVMCRGACVTAAAALDEHRFVAGLPPDVRAALAALAARRDYHAGSVLFREGTAADDLFLINSGLVAL